MQHHAARATHYDFRLEWDGVLKSWAVPKGPSPNPAEKRLAVQVEDHPLEYAGFEGVIPPGNYGAGNVIVWDRGRWLPCGDPEQGFADGKLAFELRGYKLRGRWTLVRTRRSERDWLLIKERDGLASEFGTDSYPRDSILSGLTVDSLGAAQAKQSLEARLRELGATRPLPGAAELKPMLAVAGTAFSDPAWVFELKHDGYRMLAAKSSRELSLRSRSGRDMTAAFPEIVDSVRALPFQQLVIDGEVVVHDDHGLPSFARLQERVRLTRRPDVERGALECPAVLFAFDLLACEGRDTRTLTLLERKALLEQMLPSIGPLRYSEHIAEQGEAMFAAAERMGLEGVVAKRTASRYVGRRSSDWIKVNAQKVDDFIVLGHTSGDRQGEFGALLLGQHRDGTPAYAGRVGTGFDARARRELGRRLAAADAAEPPQDAPQEKGLRWILAGPVVQVRFKRRTAQGVLRQPVFMRLRDDKPAAECRFPAEAPPPEGPASPAAEDAERQPVTLTNPDKLFWPQDGHTKAKLIEYYSSIAPWLLPYLRDRPVVLTRYPDGIDGKSFFQKDAPAYAPEWLRLETIWSEHAQREIRYFVIDDAQSLVYVANMASIPLHIWSSRIGMLERPDWAILDLDPKGAPLADVVSIARYLHALCRKIGLSSYPKTSGSTGIHVLIPLGARYTYAQSRTLAELLARVAARALGDIATVNRAMQARDGKVYIDYLQNGHGRLLVAPFSVRALPGAPVSMPLRWTQVTKRLLLSRFNIGTAPRLIARSGDPIAGVLSEPADVEAALERLQALL